MRYRDQNGQDWGDIIDFLTTWPDAPGNVPPPGRLVFGEASCSD
jgi:hypothetical protein